MIKYIYTKWRLGVERTNSIQMTYYYLDLGSASNWLLGWSKFSSYSKIIQKL